MTLREAWASLQPRLKILDPVPFSAGDWSLVERLNVNFNDREAQTRLPLAIARFRNTARIEIIDLARQCDDVTTFAAASDRPETRSTSSMAEIARHYDDDVDRLMRVLVPSARYRKGHYAYGRFTAPEPHGLHTDHSAEDPDAAGEPICIARIEALGTHYLAGDYDTFDPRTQEMLRALRYWIPVAEGEPEDILEELLNRQVLKTMPVNHVMLMVAGNRSESTQVTQHIAARPPAGGLHSAFFQRQYKLT